jgi:hypothetical protein
MIIVRLLSPGPWLVRTTKVYSGVGADIVMESISLTENRPPVASQQPRNAAISAAIAAVDALHTPRTRPVPQISDSGAVRITARFTGAGEIATSRPSAGTESPRAVRNQWIRFVPTVDEQTQDARHAERLAKYVARTPLRDGTFCRR